MGGYEINMENDAEILKINSPKNCLDGPYKVICKNNEERWAVVTLRWEKEDRVGIRWFWGKSGNPFSSGYPTWFILPKDFSIDNLNLFLRIEQ